MQTVPLKRGELQVNLKSTTGETLEAPVPCLDFRGLELALKVRYPPVSSASSLLIFPMSG